MQHKIYYVYAILFVVSPICKAFQCVQDVLEGLTFLTDVIPAAGYLRSPAQTPELLHTISLLLSNPPEHF